MHSSSSSKEIPEKRRKIPLKISLLVMFDDKTGRRRGGRRAAASREGQSGGVPSPVVVCDFKARYALLAREFLIAMNVKTEFQTCPPKKFVEGTTSPRGVHFPPSRQNVI